MKIWGFCEEKQAAWKVKQSVRDFIWDTLIFVRKYCNTFAVENAILPMGREILEPTQISRFDHETEQP